MVKPAAYYYDLVLFINARPGDGHILVHTTHAHAGGSRGGDPLGSGHAAAEHTGQSLGLFLVN